MRPALSFLAMTLLAGCNGETTSRLATAAEITGDEITAPLLGLQGDAVRGETVFAERAQGHCVLCHAVEGLNAEFQGNVGPALTGVGARLSEGQIRLRIADIQSLWPDTLMPSYYRTGGLNQVAPAYAGEPALTAQQIEDLVAYLGQLDGERT